MHKSARTILIDGTANHIGFASFATALAAKTTGHPGFQGKTLFIDATPEGAGLTALGYDTTDEDNVYEMESAWEDLRESYTDGLTGVRTDDFPRMNHYVGMQENASKSNFHILHAVDTKEMHDWASKASTGSLTTTMVTRAAIPYADWTRLFRSVEALFDIVIIMYPKAVHNGHITREFAQQYFYVPHTPLDGETDWSRVYSYFGSNPDVLSEIIYYGTAPADPDARPSVYVSHSMNDKTLVVIADQIIENVNPSARVNPNAKKSVKVLPSTEARLNSVASVNASQQAELVGRTRKYTRRARRWMFTAATLFVAGFVSAIFAPAILSISFSVLGGASMVAGFTSYDKKRRNERQITAASKTNEIAGGSSWSRQWNDLMDQHDGIMSAWVEYEIDLVKSLSYPTMLDHSVEQTATLYKAIEKASALRVDVDNMVNPIDTAYWNAVQELKVAYKVAEDHAHKMGQSIWIKEDRNKVENAERLFAIAMDDSASTNERQNAYRQARKTLEGILAIPTKGAHKLESAIALIEQGPSTKVNNEEEDSA